MADAELLVVSCPKCDAELQARPSHLGKELPCPICGASVFVSVAQDCTEVGVDDETLVVSCPKCERELQAGPQHVGKELPCPICGASVAVPGPEANARTRPACAAESPGCDAEVLWCSNRACGGKFGAKGKLSPQRLRKMTCPTCGSPLTERQPVQEAGNTSPGNLASFLDDELAAEPEAQRRKQIPKPAPEDPSEKFAKNLLEKMERRCPKCRSKEFDVFVAGREGGGTDIMIDGLVDGLDAIGAGGFLSPAIFGTPVYEYLCRYCDHRWR